MIPHDPPGADQPGATEVFATFALQIEKRAVRVAELSQGVGQDASVPVAAALAEVARHHRELREQDWPAAVWGLLYQRLARGRGGAAGRAFDRLAHSESAADEDASRADALAGPDALAHLQAALRALSSPQRFAFLLRVWEGLELRTVAAALALDEAATKTALFHALQRLHGRLAPGSADRAWVLRCRELLDDWARTLPTPPPKPPPELQRAIVEAPALPPQDENPVLRRLGFAALVIGAALLGWRALLPLLDPRPVDDSSVQVLAPAPPPVTIVETSPVAEPDYDLLADAERHAVLQDLDFYLWIAREHAVDE